MTGNEEKGQAMANTTQLTKTFIRGIEPPENTPTNRRAGVVYHDSEVPGLRVIVYPNGKRRWNIYYRNTEGRQRKVNLGDASVVHPNTARAEARALMGDVARGKDPSRERQEARRAAREAAKAAAPTTVADVCAEWLESARGSKKPKSIAEDERIIRAYIEPKIGDIPIAELDLEDVDKLHKLIGTKGLRTKGSKRKPSAAPYMANRVRALISAVLTFAEPKHRPLGSNFVRLIKPFKEKRKHNVLSELEIRRLAKVLDEWPTKPVASTKPWRGPRKGVTIINELTPEKTARRRQVTDSIRLIFATGCRRSEITHLRWSEVDLERSVLTLEDSKSGARQVVLTPAAKAIIGRQKRLPMNPYVFPSPTKDKAPLTDLKRAWSDLRKEANLEGFRMHDIRHQMGQGLADLGYSEVIIGMALGHRGHSVTHTYIGVGLDVLREALERYGETIRPIAGGGQISVETAEGGSK